MVYKYKVREVTNYELVKCYCDHNFEEFSTAVKPIATFDDEGAAKTAHIFYSEMDAGSLKPFESFKDYKNKMLINGNFAQIELLITKHLMTYQPDDVKEIVKDVMENMSQEHKDIIREQHLKESVVDK